MSDLSSTVTNFNTANQDLVTLRITDKHDNETIEHVILSSFIEFSENLPEEGWNDYKSNIAEAVNVSPIAYRIVAERNGEIIGSVFLYRNGLDAYGSDELQINNPVIRLLAVKPSARGLGVGKKLIQYCIDLAKQQGSETIHLHTSDMMARAVSLYEKLGFERAYDKEFDKGTVLVKSYQYTL